MVFALRLVRRVGLGAGVFVLLYNLPWSDVNTGVALGAAIVAFFLPGIGPMGEKDKAVK